MKKMKLTELEKHSSLEKLSNKESCSLVGAGCKCCGASSSEFRKNKRVSKKFNEGQPG